ncbi:MAG: polysaccharide deacetylase family protein [Bacteroidales bacterium]
MTRSNFRKRFRFLTLSIIFVVAMALHAYSGEENKIRLIIRSDDIGSSHAANRACIDSYTNGISRSVEVMVNCSWFPEAAKLLNEHPGYDVGVHLMLTSEWDHIKWRPLTIARSITDENGYFFPMVWPSENYPPEETLRGADWDIKEIEAELRAQIELAMKNIKNVTHLTTHMGFTSMHKDVDDLVKNLATEYNIHIDPSYWGVKRMPGWKKEQTLEEKTDTFIQNLSELKPGIYMFVEHPAYDEPEMRAVSHKGNQHVATDREHVTRIFTSERVLDAIEKYNIELIGYKDLKNIEKGKN